jgi:hypothetical protein
MRRRSEKVSDLKAKLIARLNDGFHRPGDRFLSNRALSARYEISYQTAHRLIAELCAEGYLERRPASGTYVAGHVSPLKGVELWFSARAARPGSFGAHLLERLEKALSAQRIPYRVQWSPQAGVPAPEWYPVVWEAPEAPERLIAARRYVLVLNQRPQPGLEASLIDAIATDDFSAGVCAAQVLSGQSSAAGRFAVVGGPVEDPRSIQRVAGFRSRLPEAAAITSGGWYLEDGLRVAGRAIAEGGDGIFCVNDRLAEAILVHSRQSKASPPPLIGHDNAPVAEELHLTTIEIPWDEMTAAALSVIQRRLAGDSGAARQIILAQRPVFRLTASSREMAS